MSEVFNGQQIAVDGIGMGIVESVSGRKVTMKRRVRELFVGPMGRSGKVTYRYVVDKSEVMTPDEYKYACWKGTAGPGARLKEVISECRSRDED